MNIQSAELETDGEFQPTYQNVSDLFARAEKQFSAEDKEYGSIIDRSSEGYKIVRLFGPTSISLMGSLDRGSRELFSFQFLPNSVELKNVYSIEYSSSSVDNAGKIVPWKVIHEIVDDERIEQRTRIVVSDFLNTTGDPNGIHGFEAYVYRFNDGGVLMILNSNLPYERPLASEVRVDFGNEGESITVTFRGRTIQIPKQDIKKDLALLNKLISENPTAQEAKASAATGSPLAKILGFFSRRKQR